MYKCKQRLNAALFINILQHKQIDKLDIENLFCKTCPTKHC